MSVLIIRRLLPHLRPAATPTARLLTAQATATTPHAAAMSTSGGEHAIPAASAALATSAAAADPAAGPSPPLGPPPAAAAGAATTPDAPPEPACRRAPDPRQGQALGERPAADAADAAADGHSQRRAAGAQEQGRRLLLDDSRGRDDETPTTRLDLSAAGGGTASAKLDHLGPLVVNEDGTLSRIANWTQMSDIERTNTARVLGKRNQVRLARLRAGQEQPRGEDGRQ